MSNEPQHHRKLSSWKGAFGSGALFVDEHCLISVRSSGYEERVKRLFFKDIQAIAVSKARRFAPSRWMLITAFLLLIGILFTVVAAPLVNRGLWIAIAGLAVVWLYTSIWASCRCKVYTAVSKEELVSVRRRSTARKILPQLTVLIEGAQGSLPENWRASIPGGSIVLAEASLKSGQQADHEDAQMQAGRFWASVLLIVSLLLDAALTSLDLERTQQLASWIGSALALVEASAAVWVLIRNRGIDVSLQRLGAVVLIFLGLAFYGQYGIAAFATVQAKHPLTPNELRLNPVHRTYLEIYIAGCFILAITGAILTIAGRTASRQRVMVS